VARRLGVDRLRAELEARGTSSQRRISRATTSAPALGGDCHELAAGHSPMLTHARELADLLEPYAAS